MTTVTIQLPTEIERQLRAAASLSGKSLEMYLQELAERAAREGNGTAAQDHSDLEPPADQWIAEWRAWVESRPTRPIIADDSRESIYEARRE
jgi:hypothetical protein